MQHPVISSTRSICTVCKEPISIVHNIQQNLPTCHAFECQQTVSKQDSMNPFAFKHHLEFQSGLIRERLHERNEIIRLKEEAKNKRDEDEHTQELQYWQQALKQLSQTLLQNPLPTRFPEENYLMAAVASGRTALTTLTPDRIEHYREHVMACAQSALEFIEQEPTLALKQDMKQEAHDENTDKIIIGLCTLCGGGCCSEGGEKAYITKDTIVRYITTQESVQGSEQPKIELNALAITNAYLDKLSSRTHDKSCINHTSTGCCLPTEMRSDTCNNFFCPAIKTLKETPEKEGVVAISRKLSHWQKEYEAGENPIIATALITPTETTLIAITEIE